MCNCFTGVAIFTNSCYKTLHGQRLVASLKQTGFNRFEVFIFSPASGCGLCTRRWPVHSHFKSAIHPYHGGSGDRLIRGQCQYVQLFQDSQEQQYMDRGGVRTDWQWNRRNGRLHNRRQHSIHGANRDHFGEHCIEHDQLYGEPGCGQLRLHVYAGERVRAAPGWQCFAGRRHQLHVDREYHHALDCHQRRRHTGNGTLSYTVAPNNSVASRGGSILINNQTYAVTQLGTGCNYTVAPLTANYNATGGQGQVTVQTDNACSWTVQNPVTWISNINIAGAPVGSPSGNATVSYTVAAANTSQSRTATLTVAGQSVTVNQAGVGILFTAQSIVNGASFLSGQISPGELITIFGSALGPTSPVGLQLTPDGQSVTTSLGGTEVLFDGVPAPLTYASATQVNAIVPFELAGNTISTQVQLSVQGVVSSAVTEFLASSTPAIFTVSGGSGQGAVLNQDNSPNSSSNPAAVGTVLQVFLTGAGQTNPAGVDGQLAGSHSGSAPGRGHGDRRGGAGDCRNMPEVPMDWWRGSRK